jgi:hypothetical protein
LLRFHSKCLFLIGGIYAVEPDLNGPFLVENRDCVTFGDSDNPTGEVGEARDGKRETKYQGNGGAKAANQHDCRQVYVR